MSSVFTVKVKLHEDTMRKIDKISSHLKNSDKANVIAQCVNLGDKIINEIIEGNNVIVEKKNGLKVEYKIPVSA